MSTFDQQRAAARDRCAKKIQASTTIATADAALRQLRQDMKRIDWAEDNPQPEDEHDDSPCLEDGRHNCDDWGTGEGRYHGRM